MSFGRFNFGETIPYEALFVDGAGAGITNADGKITIRRKSDDEFWTGAAWQVAPFLLTMIEISDANVPGQWKFNFNTGAPNLSQDQYVASFSDASGNAVNRIEQQLAFVVVPVDLDELERLLGLCQDNMVFDPITLDSQGRMLTGERRVYDSAANALLDDGSTGIKNKYDITSLRTGQGFLDKYTSTRTL